MNLPDFGDTLNFVAAGIIIAMMFTMDLTFYQSTIAMGVVFILMEVTTNE